jgi:hypothetical protein
MRGYFGHITYGTYPMLNLVAGPLTLFKMVGVLGFEPRIQCP